MKKIYYILVLLLILPGLYYWFLHKSVNDIYKKNINIDYQNDFEKNLIKIAEGIPPEDGQWWCEKVDGVLMADTVNNEAISYYSKLIDDTRENDKIKASFTYNANIEYIKNDGQYNNQDENLVKVTLAIYFNRYCEGLCGSGFIDFKKRTIIFNEKSEIISVVGDGECVASWIS